MGSKLTQVRVFLTLTAIAILCTNSWLLNSSFKRVSEQESLVQHTSDVIMELELILSAARDTETGIRGYVLSKQSQFLEPYQMGELAIQEHIGNLRSLITDNPNQQRAADILSELIKERLRILEEMRKKTDIRLSESEKLELLQHGKVIMDQIRAQVSSMQKTERGLLSERSRAANDSRNVFYWTLVLTTIFSSLLVLATYVQYRRGQQRTMEESEKKFLEAWGNEILAKVSSALSGDILVEDAAQKVADIFAERLGLLISKTYIKSANKLELVAQKGSGDFQLSNEQQSLLAHALSKGNVWQVTDLPEEHFKIRSSLGESKPRVLVFIPIRFQGAIIGVIESGALEQLTEPQLQLLQRSSEMIGVGLNAAISREQLKELLEKTQQQAEELEAQQEELRTNNEELEQQARSLESQQQSLSLQNRQLDDIRSELELKAQDLEQASQYKSDFLAKMSHELRTPLNGLLILATLLIENKEQNLSDRQMQFARSIQTAGNDLLALINDILDLSKIEARKLSLRPEKFSLADVLRHKKVNFGPQADEKGIDLIVDIDPSIENLQMHTDRQRLEQILRNFVSNAIKFTDKGSVRIDAEALKAQDKVRISVTDTGIGIPTDKQQIIFEAFEQVEGSERPNIGGTGLGLTISRELAHLLGGRIGLTSEERKGSTFTLEIPIQLKSERVEHTDVDAHRESFLSAPVSRNKSAQPYDKFSTQVKQILAEIPKGQKTIMIVEDEEAFRKTVADTVGGFGFYPVEAGDGELAFKLLEQFTPDAILLDIKLPGISGLGLLDMIKHLPHLRHVPVHMISALDYHQNALRRGALGYLTKPVTIEKIRAAISRIESFISEKVRKVLIIEDDARQSEAISALISGSDVKVITAKYGKEAVERIKVENFDCIILDLTLPDLSGFDLLDELNQLPLSLPPIVIYTGKDLSPKEEEYLQRFSDSIIIKGARSPERLLDEVNLFLHRVEALLPSDKREMLMALRKHEGAFEDKTVLIADDDMRNIFALTNALEGKGMKVRIAKNGLEALSQLEAHADIDIVLMDIMMPKLDGYETMKRIRASANSDIRSLPIIALTAKAMREDHEKCIQAGANDYLPKPVNLENLFTAMRVWLEQRGYA